LYKFTSIQIAEAIDEYCKEKGIGKRKFHADSGISSATLTQWRNENVVPTAKLVRRLQEYTGLYIDDFMRMYGKGQEDDEAAELRQMLVDRPEAKLLFQTAKNAPASAILEAAAVLMRYKEESERN